MLNYFALTIDIDWAPDFVISQIADCLIKNKIKATWFATHDSKAVRTLQDHKDLFEVGIHPNFLSNSTQGKTAAEIMKSFSFLKKTHLMRTHALMQSGPLLCMAVDEFDVQMDVSIFLPGTPGIQPHSVCLNDSGKPLLRIPYFWEDDVETYHPQPAWTFKNKRYHVEGLKIFNFHPMLIHLNSGTMDSYNNLKSKKAIINLKPEDVTPFINQGSGTATLFNELIEHLKTKQKKTFTISDIADEWKKTL